MEAFVLEKILPLVPAVAGVVLVIAAFYTRLVANVLGRGLDKLKAMKAVPARERESALEVIQHGLKIDRIETQELTSTQRYKLILEVMQEKRTQTKHKFWTLIVTGIIMFGIAIAWFIYAAHKAGVEDTLRRELAANPKQFSQLLAAKGYYSTTDAGLVDALASITGVETNDLARAIEQAKRLDQCDPKGASDCNVALVELRARARNRKAPFNEVGIFVAVGKPQDDVPRRFYVNVSESFPFKHGAVRVQSSDGSRALTLMPRVALIGTTRRDLIHLNEEQIGYIFGNKNLLQGSTSQAIAAPVTDDNPRLYDPSCSQKWEGKDALCTSAASITVDELLDQATTTIKH